MPTMEDARSETGRGGAGIRRGSSSVGAEFAEPWGREGRGEGWEGPRPDSGRSLPRPPRRSDPAGAPQWSQRTGAGAARSGHEFDRPPHAGGPVSVLKGVIVTGRKTPARRGESHDRPPVMGPLFRVDRRGGGVARRSPCSGGPYDGRGGRVSQAAAYTVRRPAPSPRSTAPTTSTAPLRYVVRRNPRKGGRGHHEGQDGPPPPVDSSPDP